MIPLIFSLVPLTRADIDQSILFYQKRLKEGAGVEERLTILKRIETKYQNTGVDLHFIRNEKKNLSTRAHLDYKRSITFYLSRVKFGVGLQERLYILNKIENRFTGKGVNLSFITRERKDLELNPPPEGNVLSREDEFNLEWHKYQADSRPEDRIERLVDLEQKYGDSAGPNAIIQTEKKRLETERIVHSTQTAEYVPSWPEAVWGKPVEGKKAPADFFLQTEYWWKTQKTFEQDDEDAQEFLPYLVHPSIGYDTASKSFSTADGMGLRTGVFIPGGLRNLQMGASLGYIVGPSEDLTISAVSFAVADGHYDQQITSRFLRAMLEAQKLVPVSKRFGLRLRGGAGLAQGQIDKNIGNSGTFPAVLGVPLSQHFVNRWSGFTWEVAPSLYYQSGNVTFDVGVSRTFFPKMKETEDFHEFSWDPTGIRVSIQF